LSNFLELVQFIYNQENLDMTSGPKYGNEITVNDESQRSCEIKECDRLTAKNGTTRSLINELKEKYFKEQIIHPTWLSTVKLGENITLLETEYNGIAGIVDAYKEKYDDRVSKLKDDFKIFLKDTECITNESGEPQEGIRKAVDRLRITYEDMDGTLLKPYQDSFKLYHSIQTCVDRSRKNISQNNEDNAGAKPSPSAKTPVDPILLIIAGKKKKGSKDNFDERKKFLEKVDAWFMDLSNLQNEIKTVKTRNFRKLYALFLEYSDVYNRASIIFCRSKNSNEGPYDPEWLDRTLREKFKEWVNDVYEYFYFQRDSLEKEHAVNNSWKKYEEFLKNRRAQFISEAEEIPPVVDCGG
jgi:hypothetical protein